MSAEMVIPNRNDAPQGQPIFGNITAFLAASASLGGSDADLSDVLQAIADAVVVRRPDRKVLFANEAAARVFGYSSLAAFLASPVAEFDNRFEYTDEHGNPIATSQLPSRQALRGEVCLDFTLRYRNRVTGSTGWAIVKSRPVFDDHGKVRMTVSVIHEITEQKRAEAELRQARDELEKSIAERTAKLSAANAILHDHIAQREISRNDAGKRTSSLREQARSRFLNGPAGLRLQWMAASFLFLAIGLIVVRYLYPLLVSDTDLNGQTYASLAIWSLASALLGVGLIPALPPRLTSRAIFILFGVFAALITIVLFITNSLPRMVNLPGNNDQALTEVSGAGASGWHWVPFAVPLTLAVITIVGVARRGRGEAAMRWLAMALVLWAGARFYDVAISPSIPPVLGIPTIGHSTFRLANLLRLVSASILACGAIFELRRLVIQRDVLLATEQEYSSKLEDLAVLKTDFTAMVAHELGLPISAIRTLTAMAQATVSEPEDHARALHAINVEAELMNSLVRDIETTANIEREDFSIALQPVELVEILSEAEAFAATLPGDHPLTTTIGGRAGVLVDRERIAQVLHNLLSNAAKYSPPGTPITLRAIPERSRVRIEVVDHGYGIDAQDIDRVFKKFGRGRDSEGRRVPGVGLGLYVSRRIVRMHGSDLTVISTPGAGTTFGFGLERVR
jgi:signal transduction histidine kinase